MELLLHPLVQRALAILDAHCEGIVAAWQPPWAEEWVDDMDLETLSRFPEATVHGWAMAMDGFVAFLKHVALAVSMGVRSTAASATSSAASTSVEEQAPEAAGSQASSSNFAFAPPERSGGSVAQGPGEVAAEASASQGPGKAAEAPAPLLSIASAALVVVLPDTATDWQVEVLGALVRATSGFMIYENVWRADFGAPVNVPFSKEAIEAQRAAAEKAAAEAAAAASMDTARPADKWGRLGLAEEAKAASKAAAECVLAEVAGEATWAMDMPSGPTTDPIQAALGAAGLR